MQITRCGLCTAPVGSAGKVRTLTERVPLGRSTFTGVDQHVSAGPVPLCADCAHWVDRPGAPMPASLAVHLDLAVPAARLGPLTAQRLRVELHGWTLTLAAALRSPDGEEFR